MARTALLSESEVKNVLALKGKIPVPKLEKKLKLSRSTIYRIFDGSYNPHPDPIQIPESLNDLKKMDSLTPEVVEFALAKAKLEKSLGRKITIH